VSRGIRFRAVLQWVLAASVVVVTAPPVMAQDGDQAAAPNSVLARYDKGFRFTTRDDSFSLRLNGLLQVRWTSVAYDPMVRFNDEDYSSFFVRRARLFFSGHAGSPRFTYLFQAQLEPNQGINATDLWVEYRFSDLLNLGGGRNKIAYGLEMLNSGSALGMVDRSVMYGETDIDLGNASEPGPRYPGGGTERLALSWNAPTGFATGGLNLNRSQGIQLQGRRGSDSTATFEYQLGVWQGRNTTSLTNDGTDHLASLRVGYHPWGWIDWKVVGDVDGSDRFKLGVLASVYVNREKRPFEFDESGADLAVMARWRGWSADLEWASESFDFAAFEGSFDREGWRASLGWFVVPSRLELRARVAEIQRLKSPTYRNAVDSGLGVPEVWDGDDWSPALEAKISETSVAASLIIPGWRNKLVVDLSRLVREFAADPVAVIDGRPAPIAKAPDQVDYRIRTMVQLVF
jgi:hypothetical protein